MLVSTNRQLVFVFIIIIIIIAVIITFLPGDWNRGSVFENKEKMVLVMEYAAGGELYDYLSERKVLTELEARRVFRQVASAVYYCHKVRLAC